MALAPPPDRASATKGARSTAIIGPLEHRCGDNGCVRGASHDHHEEASAEEVGAVPK